MERATQLNIPPVKQSTLQLKGDQEITDEQGVVETGQLDTYRGIYIGQL